MFFGNELNILHTICDVDEYRLKYFQNKCPDLAISTRATTYYKFAIEALLADKDVFVDKPFALHYGEGENLVSLPSKKAGTECTLKEPNFLSRQWEGLHFLE